MMRAYLAAWGDREAYAVSHVGFGMNPGARYEALTMYDQRDTNGTELRAVAGNFLFSTGANEFAGRYTAGHFDLPDDGHDDRTRRRRRGPRRRAAGCVRLVLAFTRRIRARCMLQIAVTRPDAEPHRSLE